MGTTWRLPKYAYELWTNYRLPWENHPLKFKGGFGRGNYSLSKYNVVKIIIAATTQYKSVYEWHWIVPILGQEIIIGQMTEVDKVQVPLSLFVEHGTQSGLMNVLIMYRPIRPMFL